ncbi:MULTISPECIES: hypothetical protein [Pseudomonas]|jgi:hypothetical protein|uniref:hypothetical protein n=1 Tax=Pseudomonas TaxID=286 RepID=UPI0009D9B05C|nr:MULTISPECIES: hypothetical protein [Pseudomonas]
MLEWLTSRFGKARLMRWFGSFSQSFLGAGVRVRHISDDFRVDIHDGACTLVARVEKTLYVRLKPQARQA